jgi:hypothetical protein
MTIGERYRSVADRVERAALRSGRTAADVTIVVAAKTFGAAAVAEAIAAGAGDVGENYVQEAVRKKSELGGRSVRWHLIGRLQKNKASAAVAAFDLVHTLDDPELAKRLDRVGAAHGATVRCLVEVNLGGERSKGGLAPREVEGLLAATAELQHLSVEGLMAIPPVVESAGAARRFFAELRRLRDDLARLRLPGATLKELSMGMSADFEIAVEEGATMVRIGTAIFGARPARRASTTSTPAGRNPPAGATR